MMQTSLSGYIFALGVFVGGALLGVGWAVSGYCPGTGIAAAAAGRKDALFFIAGGLLGAAAYMATYTSVKATGLMEKNGGGKVTLGSVPGAKYDGLMAMPGDILGIILGVVIILVAYSLPENMRDRTVAVAEKYPRNRNSRLLKNKRLIFS